MYAIFASNRLQTSKTFCSGVANTFVALHQVSGASGLAFVVEVGSVHFNVLTRKAIFFPCLSGTALAFQCKSIGVGASDAVLVGNALCTFELAGHFIFSKVGLGNGNTQAKFFR